MSEQHLSPDGLTTAKLVLNAGLHGQALGSQAVTNSWDANTEVAIPADTAFLHVTTDVNVHLVTDSSTNDPAVTPAWYPAGNVYKLECRGHTKLHYKAVSGTGTIFVTAFLR
jgi:hypothetical protein